MFRAIDQNASFVGGPQVWYMLLASLHLLDNNLQAYALNSRLLNANLLAKAVQL